MTFAKQLQAWRRRKGWTQRQAAEHLNMSVRTYEGWEAGRFQPPQWGLQSILKVVGKTNASKR